MSIKGDKGKSLKLVPDLLVVPPALEETARLILEADQIDGTTNVLKGTAKLHVEPALAEHPEYWFLLCTNRFLKPFIYPVSYTHLLQNDPIDPESATFNPEWFDYYEPELMDFSSPEFVFVEMCIRDRCIPSAHPWYYPTQAF